MSKLNRDQAIALVGEKSVLEVEGGSVDFTNRVTGNEWVEFSASVSAFTDGESVKLVMYVLVSQEELDSCGDLDLIDWAKAIGDAQYEII